MASFGYFGPVTPSVNDRFMVSVGDKQYGPYDYAKACRLALEARSSYRDGDGWDLPVTVTVVDAR